VSPMTQAMWDSLYSDEPSLTPKEHEVVLRELRSKETDEQRRKADRVTKESKGLSMSIRCKIAGEFLQPPLSQLPSDVWDLMLDERLQREVIGF